MKSKLIAGSITLLIITILIISGPANAFTIGFSILNSEVNKGEAIGFSVSIDISDNENINDIGYILLEIKKASSCKFSADGTILEGCDGMSIEKNFANLSFGYGYGYGPKKLEYDITLNTENYVPGTYQTYIYLSVNGKLNEKKEGRITIRRSSEMKSCSVRAKDGELEVNGTEFGKNNKINFYVPDKNAVNGEGYLTGQKNRIRFSYNFNVDDVLEYSNESVVIAVSGEYQIGIGKKVKEPATITIDKKDNKIDIIGKGFNAQELEVSFMKGC